MQASIKLLILCSVILFACESFSKRYDSGLVTTGKVGEILGLTGYGIQILKNTDTNLTQFVMPYFPDVTTFELLHRKPERFDGAIKEKHFFLSQCKQKGGVVSNTMKLHGLKISILLNLLLKITINYLVFVKTN